MDQERLQYDEREVLSLWEKVQSEPTFLQAQNPSFTDCTSLNDGTAKTDTLDLKDNVKVNLRRHAGMHVDTCLFFVFVILRQQKVILPPFHLVCMTIQTFCLVFHQFNVVLCVSLCAARDRILSNLQKHPDPRPAPKLQKQKAPVPEVPPACLTDSKAAAELMQQDLSILQDQARYLKIIQRLKHFHMISNTHA